MDTHESFIAGLPKAELHVHHVGSASPQIVAALAERHPDSAVPSDPDELRRFFAFRDFTHFITVYLAVVDLVREPADVRLLTYEVARELATTQQVRYAELTCTPYTTVLPGAPDAGMPIEAYTEAIEDARVAAERDFGIRLRWIYDIPGEAGLPAADATLDFALHHAPDALVGFGLGGPEVGVSRSQFRPHFEAARAAGLHAVPHAGETTGPETVWDALRELGAERIGHGTSAARDPELLAHLAATGVPLEVCPSSNVATRAVASLADHPLPAFVKAGVRVSINSDDPAMFNTSLNAEYARRRRPARPRRHRHRRAHHGRGRRVVPRRGRQARAAHGDRGVRRGFCHAGPMSSTDAAVSVRGLVKAYAGTRAVDGLDLDIERGEVFALLGPNGAGKSTTVEILEGYRRRDAGEVSVLGHDPGRRDRHWQTRIGIVLQTSEERPELTVRELVAHVARYYPHARDPDETIEVVGLAEARDKRTRALSGGQRRRLDVALGIVGRPELVFLDEPTTGFDPQARRSFWDLVRGLATEGTTVLLTTHYLDEAEVLADRVGVIAGGRLLALDTPEALGGGTAHRVRVRWRDPDGTRDEVTDTPTALVADLADRFGGEVPGLEVRRPSLEDVYLDLIGQEVDDEH